MLKDEARKRRVVDDAATLVESEVALRTGFSGLAVKAGYRAIQAVKPGVVEAALSALLPEFAPAIDPFYARAKESGNLRAWFTSHADEIAEALLSVTDRRAAASSHATLKRAYGGLRGSARREVAQSVPALAGLIEKHVG